MLTAVVIRPQTVYTGDDPNNESVDPFDQRWLYGRNFGWVQQVLQPDNKKNEGPPMRKASSRGFGFTAIAVLVILMAFSALFTSAEAAALWLF